VRLMVPSNSFERGHRACSLFHPCPPLKRRSSSFALASALITEPTPKKLTTGHKVHEGTAAPGKADLLIRFPGDFLHPNLVTGVTETRFELEYGLRGSSAEFSGPMVRVCHIASTGDVRGWRHLLFPRAATKGGTGWSVAEVACI
jgi:hypothetical protein